MKIRALRETDFDEWLRLRRALWPGCGAARDRLEMEELRGQPERFGVLVLERGPGRLGGFAEVALRDGVDGAAREVTAYLEGWMVEADLRGRGWGRKLIAAVERWARARGMAELASDAELDNATGIAAHAAVGFRETYRVVQFLKKLPRRR
jgi:aminoglycoside 6'-N-acetyltransferase I